jgi:acyl dehydratase
MTAPPLWEDVHEGDELAPWIDDPLTVTSFVRYQGASGDMNPIHHDTQFAQQAGYPGPFAVGMRQAGVLAGYVAGLFGAANVRRFKVQFRTQAWPGDVLTYAGRVAAKREHDAQRLVDLELSATRQTGEVHLLGWATFVVQP